MDLKGMLEEFKSLGLPDGEYAIVGSAAMAARGIREAKDLDVLVSQKLWDELKDKHPISKKACEYIEIGEVELLGPGSMYREEQGITTCDEVIKTAEVIDGFPFISLDILKKVKAWRADEKDFRDIALIDQYMIGQKP